MRDDGFRGFERLDHFLVMAAALDGRSRADELTEHSVKMEPSLLDIIAFHKA